MATSRQKPLRVFSGIQPSGTIHIGNYLGALKQWIPLQAKHQCFFSIVDLHAITVHYHPVEMSGRILSAALDYLSCGLDPKKATMFVQSHVPEHTELAWLLNTITPISELEKMTQFKEKAGVNRNSVKRLIIDKAFEFAAKEIIKRDIKTPATIEAIIQEVKNIIPTAEFNKIVDESLESIRGNASIGLIDYPVLMAADILLYKTNIVPVGQDQQQHVEFARVIARKFNQQFSECLIEPKTQLAEAKRVMSLIDPTKKMSKSLGPKHYIALTDTPDIIREKVSKAVTDTTGSADGKMSPAIQNLFLLLREFAPKQLPKFVKAYQAKTIRYVDLKAALADGIIATLTPIQRKRAALAKRPKAVWTILNNGAKKARPIAQATLKEVKEKMGLA